MIKATGRLLRAAPTLWRLGPLNLLRIARYRLLLRGGHYRRSLPLGPVRTGPFLVAPPTSAPPAFVAPNPARPAYWTERADRVMAGSLPVFSDTWCHTGFPPAWQRSVLTGVEVPTEPVHWSTLADFNLPGGDIKGYWESSRFDGLLILALAWLSSGHATFWQGMERWLQDWSTHNPANTGLQWKCGQETGLRLMQLLLACTLLHRHAGIETTSALHQWVADHCRRIDRTMLYALAQDNNHGTSEAAALFIAGAYLERHGGPSWQEAGADWQRRGRHWLNERLARLVTPDGSFSQHSTNYHRVMLDTCCLAETLRRDWGLPPLSGQAQERCAAATRWLAGWVDAYSGDAPNLGANDGARLFVLHGLPYRDFRPTVQWASTLFLGRAGYPSGPWDEGLHWLGLNGAAPVPRALAPARNGSWLQPDGGYAHLGDASCWALLRWPQFRFRPSHADALHLDLWWEGRNVLCDGGTYSYNTDARWLDYFGGTASHNTVQFDGRDQMPRLSRFLYGSWLQGQAIECSANTVAAGYTDAWGASHHRRVQWLGQGWRVTDTLGGRWQRAVLRWRVGSGQPLLADQDGSWSDGVIRIRVLSSTPVLRMQCVPGWRSPCYGRMEDIAVLEVEVGSTTVFTTEITWAA